MGKFVKFSVILLYILFFHLVKNSYASVTSATPVLDFPQTNGTVYTMHLSDDGKTLYIGGDFTLITDTIDTYNRDRLAAIDLNTLTVTSWGPSMDYPVRTIEISGGYIYVGGHFYYGDGSRHYIARYNSSDGTLDSWNPNADNQVYNIKVSGDYIYVGGAFNQIGGEARYYIARFNTSDGLLDSWYPSVSGYSYAIDISGSDIYIGGDFGTVDGQTRNKFAKLSTTNDSVDLNCIQNFYVFCEVYPGDPSCAQTVRSIKVTDDYIYVGGDFIAVGNTVEESVERNSLARLVNNESCTLDTWNPGATQQSYVYDIENVDTDIYVGGSFTELGGDTRNRIALLSTTSNLAGTWNPNFNNNVNDILISDNYLIAGGDFTTAGGSERLYLAAFPYTPPATSTPQPTSAPASNSQGSTTSTSTQHYFQIPAIFDGLFSNPFIQVYPIVDSDPGGSELFALVPTNNFKNNAYLFSKKIAPYSLFPSAISSPGKFVKNTNVVVSGWNDGIMGIKINGILYWQIGNIQSIWYKAYSDGNSNPIIIPTIQSKPSIIAFKYKHSELIPPGFPNSSLTESKLKLAYSSDGNTWNIHPSSVVDANNDVVTAVDKLGGYYTIVGRY